MREAISIRKEKEGRRAACGPGSGGMGPAGWVIPRRGENMTPCEILPVVQKSGQIFDSCPESR
ncbi:hypothetical protein BY996DRAFT_6585305 [Phakopsora pachyrhizi]|nr:hypothetical protein BY996DRAFT_6585305 [Phakopsora pachyrhizi]